MGDTTDSEEKGGACQCKICVGHRNVKDAIARRDVDELISLVESLEYDNYHLGADLNYCEGILDGSWPSSVRQLEEALEKAKNHPNRVLRASIYSPISYIEMSLVEGNYTRVFLEYDGLTDPSGVVDTCHKVAELFEKHGIKSKCPVVVSVANLDKNKQRELLEYFNDREIRVTCKNYKDYISLLG